MDALVSRYRPHVFREVFGQDYQVSQLIKILSRRYGLAPYLIASTPERGTTGKDIPNYCHVSDSLADLLIGCPIMGSDLC